MVDQPSELTAIAAILGSSLVSFEPIPWGDARATWRLDLVDGRRVVARGLPEAADATPERTVEVMRSVARAGIPVPTARAVTTERARWLVTDHVPGIVGAAWLDDIERARLLADSMGRIRRRLLDVDPSVIVTPLQNQSGAATPQPDVALATALDDARRVLAHRSTGPAFVHGDFAPINVIVGDGGEIRALLDFEHAHVGDPLEDVAWWGWAVRHHHPLVWSVAWPTFCAAAGVDPIADGPTLQALVLRELERRAAMARDPAARDRWLARLQEAASW